MHTGHRIVEITQKTSDLEERSRQQACGMILQSIQGALCQALQQMLDSVIQLAKQDCRTHFHSLKNLQAILEGLESSQSTLSDFFRLLDEVDRNVQTLWRLDCLACSQSELQTMQAISIKVYRQASLLFRVNGVNRDLLLELNGALDGLSPRRWISTDKNIKARFHAMALFLEANQARAEGKVDEAERLYFKSVLIQRKNRITQDLVTTLCRFAQLFEERCDYTRAAEKWLEALSVEKGSTEVRSVSDFKALLDNPVLFTGSVTLNELLRTLESVQRPIDRKIAQRAYFWIIYERNSDLLIQLFGTALDDGIIDLRVLDSAGSAPEEIEAVLSDLSTTPFDPHISQYKLRDSSFGNHYFAKHLLHELRQAKPATLDPGMSFSRFSIVSHATLCKNLVTEMKKSSEFFEVMLLNIVLQSRYRSEITKAPANAISLLAQMNYCFVGRDFSRIKVPGANLCGVDLTRTNLTDSDLRTVLFCDCKLAGTLFERSNLSNADFGTFAVLTLASLDVQLLSLSNTGYFLASSIGPVVNIWKVTTNQLVQQLHTDCKSITMMRFSPNNDLLAVGCDNAQIEIYETTTGAQVFTLEGHTMAGTVLAFSPNASWIASGSADKTVLLWEVAAGRLICKLAPHEHEVTAASFSSDSQLLASACLNHIAVWECPSGNHLCNLFCASCLVTTLSFSPDNAQVAAAAHRGRVVLWSILTKKILEDQWATRNQIKTVFFSHKTKSVTAVDDHFKVITWDTQTGRRIRTFKHTQKQGVQSCYSSDNAFVASIDEKQLVAVWKVEKTHVFCTHHSSQIKTLSFSSDGILLASGCTDGTITLREALTGRFLYTMNAHSQTIIALCFSLDNAMLASSSADYGTVVWDVVSGNRLHTFLMFLGSVKATCFSRDGTLIASAGDAYTAVWGAEAGKVLCKVQLTNLLPSKVRISDDNLRLFVATVDSAMICWEVLIWEVSTGAQLATVCTSLELPFICSSADGALVASYGAPRLVVSELDRGETLCQIHADLPSRISGVFSSDTRLIACSTVHGEVFIWDLAAGRVITTLQFENHAALAFSVDNKRIATTASGILYIWKVSSFSEFT